MHEWLISNRFIRVDQRGDGWTRLYQDPADGAYWELSYPHPEMDGGGPPMLTRLSVEQVQSLYDLPALSRTQEMRDTTNGGTERSSACRKGAGSVPAR